MNAYNILDVEIKEKSSGKIGKIINMDFTDTYLDVKV